ncbi:unnamed protein product [Thlaspi arvense]|uniref:Alcohol dehydrogenase-like N-terminal domain-containing protein n=1 Tax=Thlaspi arvense TaxID=13288 RepID=A0AAU9S728_THLAR|nr:unnamed protein product [Thlaspi arvense]
MRNLSGTEVELIAAKFLVDFIFSPSTFRVVESVGEQVEEVSEGDMVVPVFSPHCGQCRDCLSTKSNICTRFPPAHLPGMPSDGTSRFTDAGGHPIHHYLYVSSFSEFTVVDVNNNLTRFRGGVGAAWKVAEVEEGSTKKGEDYRTLPLGGYGAHPSHKGWAPLPGPPVLGGGPIAESYNPPLTEGGIVPVPSLWGGHRSVHQEEIKVGEGARMLGASKIIGVDLNPAKFELGGLLIKQIHLECKNKGKSLDLQTSSIPPTSQKNQSPRLLPLPNCTVTSKYQST